MKSLFSGALSKVRSAAVTVVDYGYSFADQSIAKSVQRAEHSVIISPNVLGEVCKEAFWNYQVYTMLEMITGDITTVKINEGNFADEQSTKLLLGLLAKPNLTVINASFTFSDKALTSIAPNLKSNKTLQVLDLSNNEELTANSAQTLKDIMSTNSTLHDVKASCEVRKDEPTWRLVEGYANANRGSLFKAIFASTQFSEDVSGIVYEYITSVPLPAHMRYINTLDQERIEEISDADTQSAAQQAAKMVVKQLPNIKDLKQKVQFAASALKNISSAPKSEAFILCAPELYAAAMSGNKEIGKSALIN